MRIEDDIEVQSTPLQGLSPEAIAAEWNGKEVQPLPAGSRAWLLLQIPIRSQNPLPNLSERVTSAPESSEKASIAKPFLPTKTECSFSPPYTPTVEEILERNDLKFASPLCTREVKQLPDTGYAWIMIPLQPSAQAGTLTDKETIIDTNDYRNIERVVERNGLGFAPFSSPTQWV
ncbi:MAG: hypothetical protein JSS10_04640 [Verrucomicrobia bacterium]|nr:hypothetical protein [Verrucomicrobiota bacterium]